MVAVAQLAGAGHPEVTAVVGLHFVRFGPHEGAGAAALKLGVLSLAVAGVVSDAADPAAVAAMHPGVATVAEVE